jgi:hypothetical protein
MKLEVKQKLLESRRMAAAEVAAIKAAQQAGELTKENLRLGLRHYVLAKYMLDENEAESLHIAVLAKQSLAKAMQVDKALIGDADKPTTCDGASTVDMKQALLLMAIQREFGIKLDAMKTAFAETTDELAEMIWEEL